MAIGIELDAGLFRRFTNRLARRARRQLLSLRRHAGPAPPAPAPWARAWLAPARNARCRWCFPATRWSAAGRLDRPGTPGPAGRTAPIAVAQAQRTRHLDLRAVGAAEILDRDAFDWTSARSAAATTRRRRRNRHVRRLPADDGRARLQLEAADARAGLVVVDHRVALVSSPTTSHWRPARMTAPRSRPTGRRRRAWNTRLDRSRRRGARIARRRDDDARARRRASSPGETTCRRCGRSWSARRA